MVKLTLNRKRILLCISIAIPCLIFFLFRIQNANLVPHTTNDTSEPFSISVDNIEMVVYDNSVMESNNSAQGNDEVNKYLEIYISIKNITKNDFKDAFYTIQLNEEIKPYIASQVISFKSDSFWVTSESNAINSINALPLRVSGFTHKWDLLLSDEEDLKKFFGKDIKEIENALKYVKVSVQWEKGLQVKVIPVSLPESSFD